MTTPLFTVDFPYTCNWQTRGSLMHMGTQSLFVAGFLIDPAWIHWSLQVDSPQTGEAEPARMYRTNVYVNSVLI